MKLVQGLAGGVLGMVGGLLVMVLALDMFQGGEDAQGHTVDGPAPGAETPVVETTATIRIAIPEATVSG